MSKLTKTQRKQLKRLREAKKRAIIEGNLQCGNINSSFDKEMRARKFERSKKGRKVSAYMMNRKTVRRDASRDAYHKRKGQNSSVRDIPVGANSKLSA